MGCIRNRIEWDVHVRLVVCLVILLSYVHICPMYTFVLCTHWSYVHIDPMHGSIIRPSIMCLVMCLVIWDHTSVDHASCCPLHTYLLVIWRLFVKDRVRVMVRVMVRLCVRDRVRVMIRLWVRARVMARVIIRVLISFIVRTSIQVRIRVRVRIGDSHGCYVHTCCFR